MINDFITGLFFFASLFGFGQQSFGAFSDPFLSIQLAASPQSGYILQTDGTNNSWVAAGAGSGEANTASNLGTGRNIFDSKSGVDLRFNSIAAGTNITLSTTTNNNTIVISSTASGGGSGNVATSTSETAGALAYWTSSGATPATLGNVATTTLTASSPLSLSATVWKVGGSNSILSLDTSGSWTGNAGTATALAANGSNCSAGNFPLGVDASGAVESCTDAWTQAENDAAAYISLGSLSASAPIVYNVGTGAFSWTGLATTSQPSSSQLLVSNGGAGVYGVSTSTLSATSPLTGSFVQVGSGGSLGIQNAAADGSTKGAASFNASDFDASSGNISIDYTNGQAASAANKGFLTSTDWSLFNNKVSTTSIDTISEVETLWGSINVLTETEIDASSELAALMDDETGSGGALVFASSPTITSPTLSTFFGTPCTGNEFLQDIGDTGTFSCAAASGSSGNMSGWATTTPYGTQLLLYPVDANTTDVAFGTSATTTAPFWWDVSATSTYIGNGGTGSSTVQLGRSSFEWLFGTNSDDNKFYISSSTVETGLTVNPALTIDKNLKVTLQLYDARGGTTTNATSTNLAVSGTFSLFGTLYSSLATFANAIVNAVTAVIPTGTWDFGGATSIEMVNGSNPTTDAIGEFALDTTANQLLIATSTNSSFPAVIPTEQVLFSATIGSTTPEFISSGTIPISKFLSQGREITRLECFVTGGTSKVVNVTDGTNDTETVTCGTTATADNSVDTNPTFTANELWYIEFGATTGTVNYVTVTGYGRLDRQ